MTPRLLCLGCGGLLLVLAGGCYESSMPLGRAEQGVLDPTLLGTWRCEDPSEGSTQVAQLLVIPFDRSQYFLEWREDEKVWRYRAYSTQLQGGTLFNVQELKAESVASSWNFFRATRQGSGRLSLSAVKKESLKGSPESAVLNEIARRVTDEALYEPWAICAVAK